MLRLFEMKTIDRFSFDLVDSVIFYILYNFFGLQCHFVLKVVLKTDHVAIDLERSN